MSGPPGAPTAVDVTRALLSSRLPLPTTTRLTLLSLVACAGASFATWWWLVLQRGNWRAAQLGCLPARAGAPDEVLNRFTGCVNDVRLAQSAVVLCGPLALLALALLWRAAGRRLSLWLWRARPDRPDRPDAPTLRPRLDAVLPEATSPRPVLWVRGRRIGVRARASGSRREPWIVADSHVFSLPDAWVEAMFRHELAHLRLRDVGRVRLASAAWWVLLLACTVPMAVSLVLTPRPLGTGLLVRLTVILAIVGVSLCAVLRVREHDADLGADAAADAPPGAMADYISAAHPPSRRARLAAALGLATHPTSARRLEVLQDPARTWGLSWFVCLVTGLAAGLLFTDLALLIAALMPWRTQLAYTLAGLLTGWAVAAVVTVGWWRAVAVGHRDASLRRAATAGGALGLGVLVGSQLSGRAAGNWVQDTGTADGLATSLSLTDAPGTHLAALAVLLVAGGALLALWNTSLARALRAGVRGPGSAPACAGAVVLAGLLTAVPLGSWFYLARLTAAGADTRWGVFDTPWWVTGSAVTVVGALTPQLAARVRTSVARSRTPVAAQRRAVVRRFPGAGASRRLAMLVVAGCLVGAGAGWAAIGGEFSAPVVPRSSGRTATAPPAPRAAGGEDRTVPLGELPDLPPESERTPAMRADRAVVCRALTLEGTAAFADPARRAETAGLLGAVDDPVLRSASRVLLRDPSGPVDRDAVVASVLRCDLFFRYHR
ncbi:hypothetical protein TUSST3_56500 [Streptomyces sp. TUS-ST3]|uniref:M48 family metalloprotease n=1 Tax=Streptomyces sp. TUS-ST3 TaxID=3025591 RepID=UPI00235B4CCD|nr:M48 family metalloprotease [Streptomyces sp. TUS-ST3]GLP69027.1 hypothetical protein TUSST3_56500 [Streptomyces sp. TUS-ST3]